MNRDDVIRMAREAGLTDESFERDWYVFQLEQFAALVAAAEREALCKLGEDNRYSHQYVHSFLNTIRARGQE